MRIADLRPADTPEYMTPAWIGCLSFALGNEDIVTAFRNDTGLLWKPGRTPLERMIDTATHADEHFIEAFIRWANVNIWGSINSAEPPTGEPS